MKKFILILSLILFCLPTFAQERIEDFFAEYFAGLEFAKEYKNQETFTSKAIIPTEYSGIKMGSPDMGKQLVGKGFVFNANTQRYILKNGETIHFMSFWQSIEIEDGIMSFQSEFKPDAVDIGRSITWFSISEQLGPEGETPKKLSEKGCSFVWRDKQGNGLLLLFMDNAAWLYVIPSNKTKPTANSNVTNSHEYVDLGLSVKWATCNVGASRPEEYGCYYQWAGTKDVTSTSIYLFYNNCPYHIGEDRETGWTKYNYDSSFGKVDNKKNLEPEDDIAHIMLGGRWRMPTDAEWYELISDCSWTWTTINGVKGCRVQSKKNGYSDKWIFLPAAGDRMFDETHGIGVYGYYWSSSLGKDPNRACGVNLKSDDVGLYFLDRYFGRSVRSVCP